LPICLFSQIEVVDFSKVESIRVEKYDSSYFKPNYKFDNLAVMNGLVGHGLIFLAEPIYASNVEIFQNGKKQSSGDVFKKYLFQLCKIEKIVNGKFHLSCLSDSILYKPTFSDAKGIIISEGFDKFKSNHIGKKYHSLSSLSFISLDNQEVQVSQTQELVIENIEIVKLSMYEMGVGFKFSSQNKSFTIALPFDDFYIEYGGDPKGKIDFLFEHIHKLELVNDVLYGAINKSIFKKNILKGEVVVGMTEKEIRIVWGMPTRDKMATGFDKIMIYEAGSSVYYLYLKGKKLVKISQI
jgi:hypothetical protein